jgi:hypothetical protein
MLVGLATWLRGAFRRFSVAFGVVYTLMLFVLPVEGARYLWPVYPVLAFGLARGVALLAGRLSSGSAGNGTGIALAAVVAIVASSVVWAERTGVGDAPMVERPDTKDLFRALVALNREQPMRVAFVRPQVLSLETGIPAMTTFVAPPEVIAGELDRLCITHVVLGDLGLWGRADRSFRELVMVQSDRFRLEHRNPSFEVHRYTALRCGQDLRGP